MPITQIPFQDPVAPPEKPAAEQLGLYDAQGWETAYRNLDDDARVPHLLIQLQDDLARSRRREAIYISIIVHATIILLLYFGKYLPHPVVATKKLNNGNDVTFLELPTDLQKVPHKPNTNIASDKDRVAMTRHPELDVKELRKALASPPRGMPGSPAPQMTQPQPPPQSAAGFAQNAPGPLAQQTPNPQVAPLQTPTTPSITNEFKKYGGSMSAGSAIQQATRAAAAGHGAGQQGDGGDFGLGRGAHGRPSGSLEILSDTLGVDFGPYMKRLKVEIYKHWYEVMPPSVFPPTYKKGKLTIEFAILKDGSVAGMKLVADSNDSALDRAAWGGITGSNPFPPLPPDFITNGGQYLSLRCTFMYNLEDDPNLE